MDKTRICKICNRRFANGKAMGGHMRSHLAKLPLHPTPTNNIHPPSRPPSSSSSSLNFPTTPSPVQSYRSLNLELLPDNNNHGASSASLQKPKRPRSSTRKRLEDSPEQVSSLTDDIFTEEDVALCLVMLSRDKWTRLQVALDDDDECFIEEDEEVEKEEGEEEDRSFGVTRAGSKEKTKYKCLLCNKGFKSYQALGGHKASHKRVKKEGESKKENDCDDDDDENVIEKRRFKCPFCDKTFESGQALGGHKKIHFPYLDPVNITTSYNVRSKCAKPNTKDFFDLNLPAPEDDGEVSQV